MYYSPKHKKSQPDEKHKKTRIHNSDFEFKYKHDTKSKYQNSGSENDSWDDRHSHSASDNDSGQEYHDHNHSRSASDNDSQVESRSHSNDHSGEEYHDHHSDDDSGEEYHDHHSQSDYDSRVDSRSQSSRGEDVDNDDDNPKDFNTEKDAHLSNLQIHKTSKSDFKKDELENEDNSGQNETNENMEFQKFSENFISSQKTPTPVIEFNVDDQTKQPNQSDRPSQLDVPDIEATDVKKTETTEIQTAPKY